MTRLLCVFALAAVSLLADVTGKWSGSFEMTNDDGEKQTQTALLVLKQDGGKLTGTAGPNEEKQWSIKKGTVEGNKLAFDVESEEGDLFHIDATVDGDDMTGTINGEHDGQKMTMPVKLKKQS